MTNVETQKIEYLFSEKISCSQKPLQFVPVDWLLIILSLRLLLEVIISPVGGGLLVLMEQVGAVKHKLTVTAPGINNTFISRTPPPPTPIAYIHLAVMAILTVQLS